MESTLTGRIAQEIRSGGPIRFDRFQSLALYAGEGGYYERPGRVGKEGDFVTGASWHPAFARALLRLVAGLGTKGAPVSIVDVGCGEGELLAHLSGSARRAGVRLVGVERSAVRRSRAAAAAAVVEDVTLLASLDDLPAPVEGLVVAYELLDALPVRALRVGGDGELLERCVGIGPEGDLLWVESACEDGEALRETLERRGVTLERGQLLEVRPRAEALARSLARALRRGLLLVFDYGAPARALYGPARALGTLEAFLGHRVTRDVLEEPGSRDITSWVDFTEIGDVLASEGLAVRPLVSQSRFLLASGLAEELALSDGDGESLERRLERDAIAKLVAPGGMGESIRVLVAARDASEAARQATEWPETPRP